LIGVRLWFLVASLILAGGVGAGGQNPGVHPPDVFREIDDPHSGVRWLLLRDAKNPGGPGRMVRTGSSSLSQSGQEKRKVGTEAPLVPVIRPGDKLIVEEHTATVEAHLEGVALGTARAGSPLEVRLRIGGKVVRAIALAPGRAALVPAEVRQ
jgi:hypothetical protein